MVNWKSKKLTDLLRLGNGIALVILLNLLASTFFLRVDLTEEKRYSIKEPTKQMLQSLDDKVYVEVFLQGELNAGFRRFQKAIRETLEEFRIYSNNNVQYTFTDPSSAVSQKARSEFMADLAAKGIQPTNVIDKQNGQRVEKLIFPGAVLSYGGSEAGVMFLKGNKARSPEEEINQSIEGVEFELANAIFKLTAIDHKQVGIVKGHGELEDLQVASFNSAIREVYDVFDVDLRKDNLSAYDVLVIAKPTQRFSDVDKYKLDQYIMHGGKALIVYDKLDASMDSARNENYFAFPYTTDLDDLLFRYGVRVNMDLIQDRNSGLYPIVTGAVGGKPQIQLMEWPFYPLINRYADHPVTRNLDAVVTKFVSSIDTVKAVGVHKTPLMFSSQYARTLTAPVPIDINELRKSDPVNQFTKSDIPVACLLEGRFTSLFKNRFKPEGIDHQNFKEESNPTKIIVISDGDIVRNEIHPRTRQPQPLGFDPFTNYTFANKDLIMNMLAYLTDESGLISARNKEIKIRPLDRDRIASEKVKWQLINLGVPMVILVTYGMIRAVVRRRKYASFQ